MKEDEVCIINGIMFTQEGLDNLEKERAHWREFTRKLMFGEDEK